MASDIETSSNACPSGVSGDASCDIQQSVLQLSPTKPKFWLPMCDEALKPFVGRLYSTIDEGVALYREYANACGFKVRLSTLRKKKGATTMRYCVCSREGKKNIRNSSGKRNTQSNRVECIARVSFAPCGDGKCEVKLFEERHTHELLDTSSKKFSTSSRNFDVGHQNFVINCAKSGIGPVKSYRIFKEFVGSYNNVGATVVDFKNFKRDLMPYINGADAQMVLDKFFRKKEICSAYYFNYDVDEYDRLTRIFWADPISRRNYAVFGDAVSFDATYRTNRYNMVFAPFTGLDSNNRCVVYGAGLIVKEDVNSYVWLFEEFKKAMVHEPRILVTDQDPSMKIAAERVFSITRHRFCMWHIMTKVPDNVCVELKKSSAFNTKLADVVWNAEIDSFEFEEKWLAVMREFGLEGDKWFSHLFEIHKSWIPAYYRDVMLGGLIRTTSISESVNYFFKCYTNKFYSLVELLMHFESALDTQRHKQNKLNFDSDSKMPDMKTPLAIERYCARLFTLFAFSQIQDEISAACFACHVLGIERGNEMDSYAIGEHASRNKEYVVGYSLSNGHSTCTCHMFERVGIPCRHIFLVLKDKNWDRLPPSLILGRWTKEASSSPIFRIDDDIIEQCASMDERQAIINSLWSDIYCCMGLVENHTIHLKEFARMIKEYKVSLHNSSDVTPPSKEDLVESFVGIRAPRQVNVLPLEQAKNKGSGKRIKGGKENAIEKRERPKRKCNRCKQYADHDSRNCEKMQQKKKKSK